MKLYIISSLLLMSFVFACKKDEKKDPEPAKTYPTYSMLKTGNYWIYRQYELKSGGTETATDTYDSCYIEKDTLVNGTKWFKMIKQLLPYSPYSYPEISFQRDSLHYIVTLDSRRLFSSMDFSNELESQVLVVPVKDTVCRWTRTMTGKNESVTVQAGTFLTMKASITYHMYPKWAQAGNPRMRYANYAENVGIVSETLPFFTVSPDYTIRKLVRYHLSN